MEINLPFAILLTVLAGLSTGIGSTIAFFMRTPKHASLALLLGFSAGVMVYISFMELLQTAIEDVGFLTANIAFFIGIAFIAAIDIVVPHEYEEEYTTGSRLGRGEKEQQTRRGLPLTLSAPAKSTLARSGLLLLSVLPSTTFPRGWSLSRVRLPAMLPLG